MKSFPIRLNVALVLSVVIFVLTAQLPRDVREYVFAANVLLSLAGLVFAIRYLARAGYRSTMNVLLALLGAIPLVFFAVTGVIQLAK